MHEECEGGNCAMEHANRVWKQLLADYEQPTLDEAIDEVLKDYMRAGRQKVGWGEWGFSLRKSHEPSRP